MFTFVRLWMLMGVIVLGLQAKYVTSIACAQQLVQTTQADAALVVDGVVRQVFRSPRQLRTDFLVEIEVQRCEGRRTPPAALRPPFPGPGELVYVHVFQRTDRSERVVAGESYSSIPTERTQVRAYLTPRQAGGWEGTFPDWCELTSNVPAEASAADPTPPMAERPLEQPVSSVLGMTAETTKIQDRVVVRVNSVDMRGPAHEAGVEVGDLIAGVNGAPIESVEQIEQLARRGEPFSLVVVDVRTGRAAQVQVTPPARTANTTAPAPTAPQAPPARIALGVSAESVMFGSRTALK